MVLAAARLPPRQAHADGVGADHAHVLDEALAREAGTRMQAVGEVDDVAVLAAASAQERALERRALGATTRHAPDAAVDRERDRRLERGVELVEHGLEHDRAAHALD